MTINQFTAVSRKGANKSVKAYTRLCPKILRLMLANGCLIEAKGISIYHWLKETAQTRVFMLPETALAQSGKNTNLSVPIILIRIVAFGFTLVWDNLCRNSGIIFFSIVGRNNCCLKLSLFSGDGYPCCW